MNTKETYDALIIPTGETSFGDRSFPVSNEAIRLFDSGKFGCVFVTGGYGGFAKFGQGYAVSEAEYTANFLKMRRIPSDKIYSDSRSFESVGNFTFPLVKPIYQNPSFDEFKSMLIIGQEGHVWRMRDYTNLIFREKKKIHFHIVPGKHNVGLFARVYHAGIMNALRNKESAEEIHDFLMKEHPFYPKGWYEKSPLRRKLEMSVTGLGWLGK